MGAQLGKQTSRVTKLSQAGGTRVFFTFAADDKPCQGRLEIELFSKTAPETVGRFLELVEGGDGLPSYKGTVLSRIVPGVMIQGGALPDDVKGLPEGSKVMPDIQHDEQFLVSTASVGTQFFITLTKKPVPEWDGVHIVFGRCVGGFDVLERLEKFGSRTATGEPTARCFIQDCGRCVDGIAAKPTVDEHKDSAEGDAVDEAFVEPVAAARHSDERADDIVDHKTEERPADDSSTEYDEAPQL